MKIFKQYNDRALNRLNNTERINLTPSKVNKTNKNKTNPTRK